MLESLLFMDKTESFVIEGLAGEKKLKGTVKIGGANAALKAMAAAVLFDAPVTLENIPRNKDVETMSKILSKLGATVEWKGDSLVVDTGLMTLTDIDPTLAGSMRASVVLTGPILARFGKLTCPAPGGCVIGARPIDLFIAGYDKMGAKTKTDNETSLYHIETKSGLTGTEIFFPFQTVGGTETLMMAAILAKGKTVLRNCAMEPEIHSVAEWLNECGAKITGAGTTTMTIEGTGGKLLSPLASYATIPDRIEAGSFLILGALCAHDLCIENCRPDHMESIVNLLRDSGVPIEVGSSTIKIKGNTKPNTSFKAFNIHTHEYPGFATDLQPVAVVYLTQVVGESTVFETIYEGRFKYVEELQKIGANITVMNPREIEIKAAASLRAMPGDGDLYAHDIRAGFAVVMAALIGKGTFKVNNIQLIDRGYEHLEDRLTALGANIKRV